MSGAELKEVSKQRDSAAKAEDYIKAQELFEREAELAARALPPRRTMDLGGFWWPGPKLANGAFQ